MRWAFAKLGNRYTKLVKCISSFLKMRVAVDVACNVHGVKDISQNIIEHAIVSSAVSSNFSFIFPYV